MKIAVVGTGYVGLVTGTCLAETGNSVICVDINEEKVKMMQAFKLPIYEPGLDLLFHRNIEQGRLKFTINLAEAVEEADIIFLTLPTPPDGDGAADLSYVLGASQDIAKIISHEDLAQIKNEKVLIRAHGEAPETYKIALENNITLIDASCPVVLKLQNRIKNTHDSKEKVLIFGKHGHAEVIGLQGQTNNEAIVFQDIAELEDVGLPNKFTLYSQTTKSTAKFYQIKEELISRGYEIKANDTICRQVSNRDEELRKFVKNFDHIVFVSGKKSSNGKVLFEVCRQHNSNTYFISNESELNKEMFRLGDKVGICGATSTPMWLMSRVKSALEAF